MKVVRPLAIYWIGLAALLSWALYAHGQAIGGGVAYLGHVGARPSALLQVALIVCATLLAAALWLPSPRARALSTTVLVLSSLFVVSLIWVFIPILGSLPSFLSPRAYSASGLAIQGLVFFSALHAKAAARR